MTWRVATSSTPIIQDYSVYVNKKNGETRPPKIADDTSPGRWPPAKTGRGAATKAIIQFFFCVVNTAFLPHLGAVVIPHFLPHSCILQRPALLLWQNKNACKNHSYAGLWALRFDIIPRNIGSNPFIRTKELQALAWGSFSLSWLLSCLLPCQKQRDDYRSGISEEKGHMKVYHKLSGEFPYACVSLWLWIWL